MKQEILRLSKHTLIYGGGIIISRAVSFIMLPIYTRYLTPADYGTLELLSMTIDVISMIVGMGLASSVFKFYYEYENPEEKKEVISTTTLSILTISFAATNLGIIFSREITNLVFSKPDNLSYFRFFFIIHFFQSASIIPLLYIRVLQNSTLFVVLNVIRLIIQLSLNIYFVVMLRMGIIGILYSTLLTDILIGIYLSFYTFQKVGFKFSVSKCKKLLSFGYPLIFWSLGSFVITFSDRYFLNYFSDTSSVGIYALAYKFGFLLTALVSVPFSQIWEPQRFEMANQSNAQDVFRKVFFYLNIVFLSIALIIALLIKDVLTIMAAPSYMEAHKIVPLILVAVIFQLWTGFCNIGLFLKEKTILYGLSALIAVVLSIILNLFLIPRYGVYGAGLTAVIVFGIRFFFVYIFSQRYYYINYGWGNVLKLCFLIMIVYGVRYIYGNVSTTTSVSVSIGLVLILIGVIYIVFMDMNEKRLIKNIMMRPLSIIAFLKQVR